MFPPEYLSAVVAEVEVTAPSHVIEWDVVLRLVLPAIPELLECFIAAVEEAGVFHAVGSLVR